MHKVPFVSQCRYAFPNYTCGVASTMMLLRFHCRRKRIPSYRTLRTELGVVPLPNSTHLLANSGVGTEEVVRYFRQHGIRYRATHRNTRTNWMIFTRRLRRAPAMVGMGRNPRCWGVDGHWIVVIDVSDDAVTYLDPSSRPGASRRRRMRVGRFRREWDGTSIQIVGFK
jgi:hypothetical protein